MRDSTGKGSPGRFAELLLKSEGVRAVKLALGAALLAGAAGAQSATDWIIDTFAGSLEVGDSGPAGDAWLTAPIGVAATSISPLRATTGFARSTPPASSPPSRVRESAGSPGTAARRSRLG